MIIKFNEIKEAMTSTLFCPAQEKRSVTEKKNHYQQATATSVRKDQSTVSLIQETTI